MRVRTLLAFLLLVLVSPMVATADISLAELADQERLILQWDPFRRLAIVHDRGTDRLLLDPARNAVVENHELLLDQGRVYSQRGAIYVSPDLADYIGSFFRARRDPTRPRIAAIVLDPGHGGRDPGANHTHIIDGEELYVVEKDIVLDVALRLEDLLASHFRDRTIIVTRREDVFLDLEERTEIANNVPLDPKTEAIIFVSIHANASLSSRSYGYEVWYLPPRMTRENLVSAEELGDASESVLPILSLMRDQAFTTDSILLAQSILSGFDETVGDQSRNLGLKEESWFVVRNAKMPSVLVELGFLTNAEEAVRMSSESYLQKLIEGLYTGITRFVEEYESRYEP